MKQGQASSTVYAGKPTIVSHAIDVCAVSRIGQAQSPQNKAEPLVCATIAVAPPTNNLTVYHRGTQK